MSRNNHKDLLPSDYVGTTMVLKGVETICTSGGSVIKEGKIYTIVSLTKTPSSNIVAQFEEVGLPAVRLSRFKFYLKLPKLKLSNYFL